MSINEHCEPAFNAAWGRLNRNDRGFSIVPKGDRDTATHP